MCVCVCVCVCRGGGIPCTDHTCRLRSVEFAMSPKQPELWFCVCVGLCVCVCVCVLSLSLDLSLDLSRPLFPVLSTDLERGSGQTAELWSTGLLWPMTHVPETLHSKASHVNVWVVRAGEQQQQAPRANKLLRVLKCAPNHKRCEL